MVEATIPCWERGYVISVTHSLVGVRVLDSRNLREVMNPPSRWVFNVSQMNSGRKMIKIVIDELDHNGGFEPGSEAKNLRQSSAVRWYLATCGFPAAMGPALR